MASLLLAVIYLSFISLGLPDSLLGSAWPVIYPQIGVPISWSGIISLIISAGTVISSLQSDRLTRRLGAGKVTAASVGMTAAALLGFSFSRSFPALCFWAVPYGLGAGSVDAALNNYVALHFASRHMSWLHCMWGIGASTGPYIMSRAITRYGSWNMGYRIVGILQIALTACIIFSLPLWKGSAGASAEEGAGTGGPMPLKDVVRLKGAKAIMTAFFCYCAVESTVGLWASSYLVVYRSVPEVTAAGFASMFFIGITAGRAANGFLTMRFSDRQLIRAGQTLVGLGALLVLIPAGQTLALAGLVVMGIGCAPIYPCIIHSTPALFGEENSQAMVGVQMASAYVGTCLMPPLFGFLAKSISFGLFPFYVLILLALMAVTYTFAAAAQEGRTAGNRR